MVTQIALSLLQAAAYLFVARTARRQALNRPVPSDLANNRYLALAPFVLFTTLGIYHVVNVLRLILPQSSTFNTLYNLASIFATVAALIVAAVYLKTGRVSEVPARVSLTVAPALDAGSETAGQEEPTTYSISDGGLPTEISAFSVLTSPRHSGTPRLSVAAVLGSPRLSVAAALGSPRNSPRHSQGAHKEQEPADRAKLQYIARTAHELRTPLQSFHLSLELLRQSELTPMQADVVQQAAIAADLMKLTVNQVLEVEAVLGGTKLVPHRTAVSIRATLDHAKSIINGFGQTVPVTFEVSLGVADAVFTDEEWLWENLVSLLTNACKNTTSGSIRVVVSVLKAHTEPADPASPIMPTSPGTSGEHTLLKKALSSPNVLPRIASAQSLSINTVAQMLRFEVIDTGAGISADKLDSIFDPFAQIHDHQATGTGLGLFGVRMRAEGLLGTCGARPNTESSTGTGTVVWFTVPYQPDTTTETPKKKSPVSVADLEAFQEKKSAESELTQRVRDNKLVAMVVEDTVTIRKLMQRLLLKLGFARVDCYENGSKGLEAMMAEPVDIVFSDVQMPVMTGDEMVAKFRAFEEQALLSGARPSRQLVVAVTANGADWSQDCADKRGFDFICPKPVASTEINKIIAGYLSSLEEA